jgi:hypothetical protein
MMSYLVQWYVVASAASSISVLEIFAIDTLKKEDIGNSDQSIINVFIN